AGMADEIAAEEMDQGRPVAWPPGMDYEHASRQADYPPAIWTQAQSRWDQLGEDARQEMRRERIELAAMLGDVARGPSFAAMFSPWDLLWFGLATVTAFRIGVGSYSSGDD